MSTITLYKDKLNGAGSLIDKIIKSSNNINVQLGTLKSTLQGVDSSTCNLQDTVDSISSSSKSHKEKVEDLKKLNRKLNDFINTTVKRDNSARDQINKEKKDFYSRYKYLKPECEKSRIEKLADKVKKVAEWCKEHWKLIATILIVVASIVVLCIPGVGPIIAGACWGAILGAVIGGVSGGLESMANGGSFLAGFENGAFSGAVTGLISGAAFAGIGQLGAALGKGINCASKLGKCIKGVATVSKAISTTMSGFDTLSLLDKAFGSGHIADLNAKLHSNKAYNIFQTGVAVTATFTGGMSSTMSCFIAGTMVATLSGLVAIENICEGDYVLSRDSDNSENGVNKVVSTFKREVTQLIHLNIGNEEIVTTYNHPFFVNGKGFVAASDLWIGAELQDISGNIIKLDGIYREDLCEDTVNVYNLKVENHHTYFIGNQNIWVHNAECTKQQVLEDNRKKGIKAQEERHNELIKTNPETQQEITIRPYDDNGNLVDYNVRVDELNNDFFNEVKASETAPYTKNQKQGYELLQRNGGEIRGAGKPGFKGGTPLGPTSGYTTRNGKTVPVSQDLALHGGGK